MNKRVPEASALREFFYDQWEILQSLIAENQLAKIQKQIKAKRISQAVEHIVDSVDGRIKGVGSFEQKLRTSAHELLDYIEGLIAKVPEPISINKDSYLDEPLVNALFSRGSELEQLLIESSEIQECRVEQENHDIYALLVVLKDENEILGKQLKGDVITADVRQTAINFYGHKIAASTASESDTRSILEKHIFDSVIASIRSHLVHLRKNQVVQALEHAVMDPEQNMHNPETYLRVLTEQLSKPQHIVSLQSHLLKISKMGILLDADSSEAANELTLNELVIDGYSTQAVTLIQFKCDDWLL